MSHVDIELETGTLLDIAEALRHATKNVFYADADAGNRRMLRDAAQRMESQNTSERQVRMCFTAREAALIAEALPYVASSVFSREDPTRRTLREVAKRFELAPAPTCSPLAATPAGPRP